jgi:hypothetical protein
MQLMGFNKGPSVPSMLELEAYDRLFDSDLTTSKSKALDELFLAIRSKQLEDARPPSRSHHLCRY